MRYLQPSAFGEPRRILGFIDKKFVFKQEKIPFLSKYSYCKICNRTIQPYASYLPSCKESDVGPYKHFNLRFEIMIYALACYPGGFGRQTVMQNSTATDRTQQRILQSLVREGFLEKNERCNPTGAYYRIIPSKIKDLAFTLNKNKSLSVEYASTQFLPVFNKKSAGKKSDSNALYEKTSSCFSLCMDILTFASACGENGFTRKDVMSKVDCLGLRTQQRLLESWVDGGFLEQGTINGNVALYKLNPAKTELLLSLINRIEL